MASKPSADTSRRTSIVSLFSGVSQTDNETLSQALDQIHSTASQTGVLTTFSQLTAPPPSSSGTEAKGIANDLQGGLSGLYSRFKASVGGVKDLVAPGFVAGNSEADDASSTKSNRTPMSTPTSSVKQAPHLLKHASPSAFSGTVRHEGEQFGGVSQLQSSVTQNVRTTPLGNDGQASAMGRDSTTGSAASSNLALPQSGPGKPAHPLTQAGPSSVVQPAVVEVNISASTSHDLNNGGTFGTREAVSQKSSKMIPDDYVVSRSNDINRTLRSEDLGSSQLDLDSSTGLRAADIDHRLPRDLKLAISISNSTSNTPRRKENDKRLPRRMTRISEVNGDTRGTTSSGDFGDDEQVTPKQSRALTLDGTNSAPDETLMARNSMHLPRSMFKSENGVNSSPAQEPPSDDRLVPPRSRQVRDLPGFTLSRGSSTDTAGGSSVATDINSRSVRRGGGGDEVAQAPNILQTKAAATTQTFGDPRGVNVVLSQIKSKVLSKEYWMRDENAKDCFYCGDLFSTFRRKHHCSM